MRPKTLPPHKVITIFQLTREAHSFLEAEKCAEKILDRLTEILGTEVGSVMLLDEKRQELFIKKAKGLDEAIAKTVKVKIGEGISGWVAKSGRPLLIRDLSRDRRFKAYRKQQSTRYTTESLLSVPLKIGNRVLGVINVNNKKAKKKFTMEDLLLLSFIAEQVAIAIQNALIYEETKRLANLKLDFLSDVSHELKNPLAVVRESIAVISDSMPRDRNEEKTRILEMAIRNIDRINRLLNSLLDLAKMEAGKAPMHRSYIDIKRLITDCVDFIKPPAKAKGIKIRLTFAMKYSRIWADQDMITQVMNNILSNAVKFTPAGGRIDAGSKEIDGKVLIWVKDTGEGIRKEDIPRLFSKFERLSKGSDKTEGTGLGLAICKEIVDMHRGRIWADSKFAKGTQFNVVLPKELRRGPRHD